MGPQRRQQQHCPLLPLSSLSSLSLPLASLLLLLSCSSLSQASNCPAFTTSKLSCGEGTCGRYVFRGSFRSPSLTKFRVPALPDGIRLGDNAQPADCCQQCRQHEDCAYWNYFVRHGKCVLYTAELCQAGDESAAAEEGKVYNPKEKHSFVGGRCNSKPYSDQYYAPLLPHTKQQKGQLAIPPSSFCLVSDSELHINMLLSGYRDNRTEVVAASVARGHPEAKVRTWIREIGLVWNHLGKIHTVRFVARQGVEQDRGDGFMGGIHIDGVEAPRLMLGDELNLFDGQGSVLFDSYEKVGPYDVDLFVIKIDGIFEAELRVRAAHPLLQEANDAEVHFNMDIIDVAYTRTVHGVLGQSYRAESEEKTLNYGILASLFGAGEGTKVEGLQGRVEDYWSSNVLLPDCKFSQFQTIRGLESGESVGAIDGMGIATQKAKFMSISSSTRDL